MSYSAVIAGAVAVAVFTASMVGLRLVPHEMIILTVGVLSLCAAVYATGRLAALQARVWCLKMSPHMIMGYNHARRPTTFAWSQVDYVAITDDSVVIAAGGHPMIEIPSSFDDFVHVSHRVLDLAELHRRPVHVRGCSIAEVDLYVLLPELKPLLGRPVVTGPEPV